MKIISNYINGSFVESESKKYIDVYDPSIAEVYAQLPDSDAKDINLAVQAAEAAFPHWSATSAEIRSQYLMKIHKRILERKEELVFAESIDQGKTIKMASTLDIPRAASNFYFFASGILHFASESHSMENGIINYTLRNPIGVVACISPWNLPLYLFTWKIAPALAAGNCVVAKPSEITPMTAYLLSEICAEIGLPPGVLNIVHGLGPKVGQAIAEHPLITAISFTGGTSTGKIIAQTSAPMFKKLSLEMGGKNPAIIFADCNYEKMLKTLVNSSFSNQGEICLCSSRILIEKSIYEKFKEDFVEKVKNIKVGDPLESHTDMGAIASEMHFNKIISYIELAKQEGGKILCGGNALKIPGRCENGWFIEPTVIEGLSNSCRTNQEEIFGPVVTLIPFENIEEAIHLSNDTMYGLAASVWTESLSTSKIMTNALKMGIVWVNCWLLRDLRTPFGGVKNSGIGREGGWEALKFFTEVKNVCISD